MSRTKHATKGPSYEYWGKRPSKGILSPGKQTKKLTHKLERRHAGRALTKDTL